MNVIEFPKSTDTANHELKKTYVSLLLPALGGLVLISVLQNFFTVDFNLPPIPGFLSAAIFIVSAFTAIALPIFYRTLFANKMRGQTHTLATDWLKFERRLIYIAMATPYLSLIARILELQRFHLAGTLIMSFYAAYYYYPSKKRIDYDRSMFRVYTAP
ncbi:MAG: hypothetical protein JSV83_01860 [Desulfobacterales bacterium]|nr:MAG: hypothetical protein JSV83_01860 [Desulfobacterales bacterium]